VGRLLAHRALASLAQTPLLRGEHGEPAWPPGFVGSITHTDALAALACAPQTRWAEAYSPAIDLERLDRGISDPAWEHILALPEWEDTIVPPVAWPHPARMIVFSAKESLFKALFPACKVHFGFQDADLTRESAALLLERFPCSEERDFVPMRRGVESKDAEDLQEGWLTLRLRRTLGGGGAARFPEGMEFSCHYEICGGYLLTAIIRRAP